MTPYDPTQQTLGRRLNNPKIDEILAQRAMLGQQQAPMGPAETEQPQPPPTLQRPPMAAKPLATIKPTPPSANEQSLAAESARLNAPPPADRALTHTKANTGAPGAQQVHNPFLRALATVGDAIGSGLFPNIAAAVPGTTIHHQVLAHNNAAALEAERKARGEQDQSQQRIAQANQAETQAEVGIPAEAAYHNAEAEAKLHPGPERITNEFQKWMHDNPQGTLQDWENFKAANVQAKPAAISTPFEKWMKDNPQGTVADWFKLQSENKPERVEPLENQIIQEHLTKTHPGESMAQARQHTQPAPQVDPTRRADTSYTLQSKRLDTISKPVQEASMRLGRLRDTLAQNSPQADALVGPELLTVMAGGQGSGLRMNEAEIARIIGGRSHWESLKAAINKWQLDPKQATSITPEQRQQIRTLVGVVGSKLEGSQRIIDAANEQLLSTDDAAAHRRIVVDAQKKLTDLQSGGGDQGTPSGTGGYQVGHKYGNLTYLGGDPNKRESWK